MSIQVTSENTIFLNIIDFFAYFLLFNQSLYLDVSAALLVQSNVMGTTLTIVVIILDGVEVE